MRNPSYIVLFSYCSDDLPKIRLKMCVANSLKSAIQKLKEQEKETSVVNHGNDRACFTTLKSTIFLSKVNL